MFKFIEITQILIVTQNDMLSLERRAGFWWLSTLLPPTPALTLPPSEVDGVGWVCIVTFMSNPTELQLRLNWVELA